MTVRYTEEPIPVPPPLVLTSPDAPSPLADHVFVRACVAVLRRTRGRVLTVGDVAMEMRRVGR